MLEIRSCIDDPGTCNCDDILNLTQKSKCEKMISLAIKCGYQDNKTSCDELESMKPSEGDGYAESFIPPFLMNLFNQKKDNFIDYNISKSDVPPECYNENEMIKKECAQYRYLKELNGECFDKEGLINYLTENEINNTIIKFENSSEQFQIDFNGKEGQNLGNDLKNEINKIEDSLVERTFANGTYETKETKEEIKIIVVEGGNNSGDDGLKPEIKTEIASGGYNQEEPLTKQDLSELHYDPSKEEIIKNEVEIKEGND